MNLPARLRHWGGSALRAVGLLPPRAQDTWPRDAWTQTAEYEAWFIAHRATDEELDAQRATAPEDGPVFSIVVPLFRTPREFLRTMAGSVRAQTYPHWELILVNASPEDRTLAGEVAGLCAADRRIHEVKLGANRGIAENTNAGIAAATGDFVAFLDHDDLVEPDALWRYREALEENPQIDVLYCDEDLVELDEKGLHPRHPLFKASPSPELMLCKNDAIHWMCIRRSILGRMPTPDSRYDGSQDYNMILFAWCKARAVRRVPRVLYHWRMSEESTAARPTAKSYAQWAGRLGIENELRRSDSRARIIGTGIINLHNLWFPASDAKVSLVVDCGAAVEETQTLAQRFLDGYRQGVGYPNAEAVLVGREAVDLAALDASCEVKAVVYDGGRFARLNAGARVASGDFLVFIDATSYFVSPEPLAQLTGVFERPGVVAAAPKVLYRDERVKGYGIAATSERIMPLYRGYPVDFPAYQCDLFAFADASAAGWQGLTVPASAFSAAGGFDERFTGEVAAVDLCHRLMANDPAAKLQDAPKPPRVAVLCTARLHTDEALEGDPFDQATNAEDFSAADVALFDQKWPELRAAGDPFFSPNLDQSSSYYQVQAPAGLPAHN